MLYQHHTNMLFTARILTVWHQMLYNDDQSNTAPV